MMQQTQQDHHSEEQAPPEQPRQQSKPPQLPERRSSDAEAKSPHQSLKSENLVDKKQQQPLNDMKKEKQQLISKQDKEIGMLKEQLAFLKSKCAAMNNLKVNQEFYETHVLRFVARQGELQSEIDNLNHKIKTISMSSDEQKRGQALAEERSEKYRVEYESLFHRHEENRIELNRLKAQRDRDRKQSEKAINQLTLQLHQIRTVGDHHIKIKEGENYSLKSENIQLRGKSAEKIEEVTKLSNEKEKSLQFFKQENQTQKRMIESLKEQLNQRTFQLSGNQQNNEKLQHTIKSQEREIVDIRLRLRSTQSVLEKYKENVDYLQRKIKQIILEKDIEIKEKNERIIQMSYKVSKQQQTLKASESQLIMLRGATQNLKEIQRENINLQQNVSELNNRCSHVREAYDKLLQESNVGFRNANEGIAPTLPSESRQSVIKIIEQSQNSKQRIPVEQKALLMAKIAEIEKQNYLLRANLTEDEKKIDKIETDAEEQLKLMNKLLTQKKKECQLLKLQFVSLENQTIRLCKNESEKASQIQKRLLEASRRQEVKQDRNMYILTGNSRASRVSNISQINNNKEQLKKLKKQLSAKSQELIKCQQIIRELTSEKERHPISTTELLEQHQ